MIDFICLTFIYDQSNIEFTVKPPVLGSNCNAGEKIMRNVIIENYSHKRIRQLPGFPIPLPGKP